PDNEGRVEEDGEHYKELLESVRALRTVYQRLHVVPHGSGYMLVDGEHRWRAAGDAGLSTVPCDVWPPGTTRADVLNAGLLLNAEGKKKAYGPVHTARALRELKNAFGLTQEEIAARNAIPRDRVADYLTILSSSDYLLNAFEKNSVPLRICV